MLAVTASLGLIVALGDSIRWNASVETQMRAIDEPGPDRRAGLGELDVHAQVGLSTQGPDGVATLTYSPSFLLRQAMYGVPTGNGNSTLHGGGLELQTRLAPTTRLASRTVLTWGLTDFSPLSGQVAPPTVGPLPPQRFVRTLGVESMLDLTHAFSRRLRMSVAAGIQRSGGLGHEAVSVLPIQVGPKATVSLAWAMDRTNAVTLLASAAESRFSIGTTAVFANLETNWTHRASSHTLLDAAAGLSVVRSSNPGSSSSAGAYPAGALGTSWELPMAPDRTLRTSLRLRLAPGVDQFTALAIQTIRSEGLAELAEGRLRLALTGSHGHVISGAAVDDLRFEARSSWNATRQWALEGGVSAARTNQLAFQGWQAQVFVGLRWTDRGWF